MNDLRIESFDYSFRVAGQKDIGRIRTENQDEIMICSDIGFFGVSDGMGGLAKGAQSSEFVSRSMPELMHIGIKEFKGNRNTEKAEDIFSNMLRMVSRRLFEAGNTRGDFFYGATFSGVWLLGKKAIFLNLGDSRGYILSKYKKHLKQITKDHNLARVLVEAKELTPEEASHHSSSSCLTAFVGMEPPVRSEFFVEEIYPGDRILLCSDGLYSMMNEKDIVRELRSSKSPKKICERLIERANQNGGIDNISVIYIKISA